MKYIIITIFLINAWPLHESFGQQSVFVSKFRADSDPQASFTLANSTLCQGDSVEFTNTSTTVGGATIKNVHWYFGDGFDTRTENPTHRYTDAGDYTVSLVAIVNVGGTIVTDSTSQQITINPTPEITFSLTGGGSNFTNDTIFYQGGNLNIAVNEAYSAYLWAPSGSMENNITVNISGIYTVAVLSNGGCTAKRSQQVVVKSLAAGDSATIIVQNNVLTPNMDGINDYLTIQDIDTYENPIELYIYNIWGDLVYTNKDYQNNWDATFEGNSLDSGTYYYVITSEGRKGKIGFVDILK